MSNEPHDPAYFRDATVKELRRRYPDEMVCGDDVWVLMVDDPRVVEVSTLDDLEDARHRFVLAAAPEVSDS